MTRLELDNKRIKKTREHDILDRGREFEFEPETMSLSKKGEQGPMIRNYRAFSGALKKNGRGGGEDERAN